MTYWPSEAATPEARGISWVARKQGWPHYKTEVRRRVTDIPVNYRAARVEDAMYANDPDAETVTQWVADVLQNGGHDAGLLFMGLPGRGKTRMACAAANTVSDWGMTTKFITAPNLHRMSLSLMQMEKRQDEEAEVYADLLAGYHTYQAWPLLVLDDMGRERSTGSEYSEHLVEELLRDRYDTGSLTIVTTNLDRKGIEERYGARMSSLIEEMFWIIGLTGPDWRRQ